MYHSFKASLLIAAFMISSAVTFISCDKDDDVDKEKTEFTINATVNGQQEVPAVTTNGSGTLTGTYNKNTNLLTYSISWQQLSGPATGMHFHGPANAGEPAGVALGISGFPAAAAGSFSSSATLTDAQENDLVAGKWYINIHTEMHPPGEIRGQVSLQ